MCLCNTGAGLEKTLSKRGHVNCLEHNKATDGLTCMSLGFKMKRYELYTNGNF